MDQSISSRLAQYAHWLQQEGDILAYTPDDAAMGPARPARPHDRPTYILDGHRPVPVPTLGTWGAWFATADRTVARTTVAPGLEVSTVFLGVDYQRGLGPPLLFETRCAAVVEAWHDVCQRYTTWEDAARGHTRICEEIQRWLDDGACPCQRTQTVP